MRKVYLGTIIISITQAISPAVYRSLCPLLHLHARHRRNVELITESQESLLLHKYGTVGRAEVPESVTR